MTTATLRKMRSELRDHAEPSVRAQLVRVLSPAVDDELLGVRVPVMRELARQHRELPLEDVDVLLHSGPCSRRPPGETAKV
ncbi:DNA alkylation repair protein [Streptomyces sp. NPDC058676]|uniref:DNA alkylation repair protein n=1 Tax=unclassified Streptomyces TaxID=2593676 RepID=UPI003668E4F1